MSFMSDLIFALYIKILSTCSDYDKSHGAATFPIVQYINGMCGHSYQQVFIV